jgi:predicted DNA-binding ribbon-helix-helix protein
MMCRILSSQHVDSLAYQTRSVRLGGHATSIKLEGAYWDILEEIASVMKMPLGRFLTEVHDEVLSLSGNVNNFTSLLRCACLTYVSDIRGKPHAADLLRQNARKGFSAPLQAAE